VIEPSIQTLCGASADSDAWPSDAASASQVSELTQALDLPVFVAQRRRSVIAIQLHAATRLRIRFVPAR